MWESYLAYIDAVGADAAFMYEPGPMEPLNSGNFVALPTERMRALVARWVALGAGLADEAGNQKGLQLLAKAGAFDRCGLDAGGCADVVRRRAADEARAFLEGKRVPAKALIRTYDASFWSLRRYQCALSSPDTAQVFDPCGWEAMYAHPICTGGGGRAEQVARKMSVLRAVGFWLVQDPARCARSAPAAGAATRVPRCLPLAFEAGWAHAEDVHLGCSAYPLAWEPVPASRRPYARRANATAA